MAGRVIDPETLIIGPEDAGEEQANAPQREMYPWGTDRGAIRRWDTHSLLIGAPRVQQGTSGDAPPLIPAGTTFNAAYVYMGALSATQQAVVTLAGGLQKGLVPLVSLAPASIGNAQQLLTSRIAELDIFNFDTTNRIIVYVSGVQFARVLPSSFLSIAGIDCEVLSLTVAGVTAAAPPLVGATISDCDIRAFLYATAR